ncbi:hypothetical protein [Pseudoalteromonas sp. Of11M-6]|uniref:hypothetical protein n=1 Tax=Pseudoalteromonas sp. Of11M-6 TaxID=2917754 RepID=UPI001EF44586|nr:hypothetical protein [Pseudoalteromonas sp. Of11M-6]MCG7553099.1 hypothetical protein [Pseudoalteromonas sp. Of11M-6]
MGGKSKSSQSTATHQTSTSVVNDGQFAGASNVDASRTDIRNDYDIDNSVRQDYAYDFEIDNSLEQEWSDSFNTDNSINNDGDFAGNRGIINMLDGGAIEAAKEISLGAFDTVETALETVDRSLDANSAVARNAISSMAGLNADLADVYSDALSDSTENTLEMMREMAGDSLSVATGFSDGIAKTLGNSFTGGLESIEGIATSLNDGYSQSLDAVTSGLNAVTELTDKVLAGNNDLVLGLADSHTENLGAINGLAESVLGSNSSLIENMSKDLSEAHQSNLAHLSGTQSDVTQFLATSASENMKANTLALDKVAALAKSTSLQGQDLVAQSASSMIKYISVALGLTVAVVAVALIAGKK